MSYDLYFYKQKGSNLSEDQISKYLTDNLVPVNENGNQWFYENEDTEVYYSFDQNEPENDPESIELYENFADFDNTHFSFNLNFLRPAFFGLEAFRFIEQFIADLNLFVLNPQSDAEKPFKPTSQELFENWNTTNLGVSKEHFKEMDCCYLSMDKSSDIWNYNYNRIRIQKELGEQYFVPKIFFFKIKETNEVITISSWTEHIPALIPPVDYILLTRKYKRFFRTVTDNILVSRDTIMKNFQYYFDEFDFKDCKIIHPDNAFKIKDGFNSLKSEQTLADFAERVPIENLYNAKPD